MQLNKHIFGFVFTILTSTLFSQTVPVSNEEQHAEKLYAIFNYEEAISYYEVAQELSLNGLRHYAKCHEQLGDFEASERIYSTIVLRTDINAEDLYAYAYVLRKNRKYNESDNWMNKYAQQVGENRKVISYKANKGFISNLLENNKNVSLKSLAFNSSGPEMTPSIYKNGIVFSAPSTTSQIIQRKNASTNDRFLDLYFIDTTNFKSNNRKILRDNTGKKFNESAATFSSDYKTAYFTRNSNQISEVSKAYVLEICSTNLDSNGIWTTPIKLSFNTPNFSCAHPALSADGKTLYFASNMPGGLGGVDIWKTEKISDTSWSIPVNLGERINTEGNEQFPFISKDGKLFYFSSDGHYGLGGMDLFVSEMVGTKISEPMNLGTPINTSFDDFALVLSDKMNKAYFTSNRTEGKGSDDIFEIRFTGTQNLRPNKIVKGTLKDSIGNPIPNVSVAVLDAQNNSLAQNTTNEKGEFELLSPNESGLKLRLVETNYDTILQGLTFSNLDRKLEINSKMKRRKVIDYSALVGKNSVITDTVYKQVLKMDYKPIYFQFNSAFLSRESRNYLDGIVLFLNNNIDVQIDLKGFTDCIGDAEYNLKLAERRLDRTLTYIKKGLKNKERIVGTAVGEVQVEGCDCNIKPVTCDEETLKLNRKVEIQLFKK